jgi:hypothetical protein
MPKESSAMLLSKYALLSCTYNLMGAPNINQLNAAA